MEMASWFKTKEGYIFLTDEDIIAYHENNGESTESIDWNNFVGHGGLMRVFRIGDRGQTHHEGFVEMPDVIRKTALDGKMDMMFAHADNLNEATPEFIPLMQRLANRFPKVKRALAENPYVEWKGGKLTNAKQMKVGVERGFKGSTIGQLLRHRNCDEESMLIALKGATEYMDTMTDHHHYYNIIMHPRVTKVVLQYIISNVGHGDVQAWAQDRLKNFKVKRIAKMKALTNLKVKTIKRGNRLIRTTVAVKA
jgi:hypothetical protein